LKEILPLEHHLLIDKVRKKDFKKVPAKPALHIPDPLSTTKA
jgi:hypothetical protein